MGNNLEPKLKNQLRQDSTEGGKSKKVKKEKNEKKSFTFFTNEKFIQVLGLFFIIFSVYLLIIFISHLFNWKDDFNVTEVPVYEVKPLIDIANDGGYFGVKISQFFINKGFGIASFLFIYLFGIIGIKLLTRISLVPIHRSFVYSIFGLVWVSVSGAFLFENHDLASGLFGHYGNIWLTSYLGKLGTGLILLFTLVSFLVIYFNLSFKSIVKEKTEGIETEPNLNYSAANEYVLKNQAFQQDPSPTTFDLHSQEVKENEKIHHNLEIENGASIEETDSDLNIVEFEIEQEANELKSDEKITEHYTINTPYDPTLDLRGYKFPHLDLLADHGSNQISVNQTELEENKNKIIRTLGNYAIEIQKIKATIGPTVTLYEIIPAPGVRISKIKNLEDDIALSLSALGIRIIAPMPGKGTIGIEVPNQKPEIVSMKTILSSEKFQNSKFDLPIGLGKTISNESFIADLTKMPHLLMAGATGQGKSVGLNAIIASLIYKKHPSQVKFVLVDPKKVELNLFSKIERHYLAKLPDSEEAIITDTRKVVRTLNSLCIEMDHRYELLKDGQVRNIKEYNEKFIARKLNPNDGHRFLPYIVLIVDEFADLIMTAGKEIEAPIARLAQLARAIGIHLIIATQRPSVNIITGTIKANFPARMAFRVTSKIDSRTILDTNGADQLIGRGDMLLATGSDLIRLQCAFIDIDELETITEFIGSQRAYPEAYHLPEYDDEESTNAKVFDSSDKDDLFEDAAHIVVQHQHGSTSLIQRKLKLGYNRAGRIIDQLEAAGVVGPFEGSKAREVLIKDILTLEQFLKSL